MSPPVQRYPELRCSRNLRLDQGFKALQLDKRLSVELTQVSMEHIDCQSRVHVCKNVAGEFFTRSGLTMTPGPVSSSHHRPISSLGEVRFGNGTIFWLTCSIVHSLQGLCRDCSIEVRENLAHKTWIGLTPHRFFYGFQVVTTPLFIMICGMWSVIFTHCEISHLIGQ